MALPPPNQTFGPEGSDSLSSARRDWIVVANTIVKYEPLTLAVTPGQVQIARELASRQVDIVQIPVDDAWIRDSGPTFVHDPSAAGGLAAVDWTFNGWGGQSWARWDHDAQVARSVADLADVPLHDSPMTNEGGGFHVDGDGTVLLTETVQLDPGRNPGWTHEHAESEIHARLGTSKAIWLPRGLTRDYDEFGTRGHVDIVAAFVRPGAVVVHTQDDPSHPDFEVSRTIIEVLSAATDARGRRLDVIPLLAPTVREVDGEIVDYSYINHYVANGVVVLCAFDDSRDAAAAQILSKAYPDRVVELVDARGLFACGGGIHCITQQQPVPPDGTAPPHR